MAFTYCTNCGEKIDMDNARCPFCGYTRQGYSYERETFEQRPSGAPEQSAEEKRPFEIEERWNGNENSGYGQGNYESGHSDRGYGYRGNPYQQGNPLYRTPNSPMSPKRPLSVGLTVFSIINIIFSCCAFPSLIFGILALFNTIQAQNAESEEQEIAKKKIALVLNVVGAVLTVLTIVSFTVVFAETLAQIMANGGI
jgi:hypothetical protein